MSTIEKYFHIHLIAKLQNQFIAVETLYILYIFIRLIAQLLALKIGSSFTREANNRNQKTKEKEKRILPTST